MNTKKDRGLALSLSITGIGYLGGRYVFFFNALNRVLTRMQPHTEKKNRTVQANYYFF